MKKSTSFLFVCFATLLSGALPATVMAQSSASTASSASFRGTRQKAAAKEVTVTATIQQVLTKAHGNSAVRLLVSGQQGAFNADLGPYLAKDVKESLTAGTKLQLAGTMQTIQGQSYLMARQLTIADHQIIIRNENGSLVRTRSAEATQKRQNNTTTGDLQ